MNILIVGAGIGGLTLAIALKKHGVHPEVIERFSSIKPVGAGITIQANAMNVLENLGLAPALKAAGQTLGAGRITDGFGHTLVRLEFSGDVGHSIALHRHELHQVLFQAVQDQVRLGCGLTSLQQYALSVEVGFSDGASKQYDVVVGADGIRSTTRRMVLGAIEPRYAGYGSWRFVVNSSVQLEGAIEIWGSGARLGLVPVGQGRIYGFVTFNHAKDTPDEPETRLTRVHQWFGQFPIALEVLSQITDPNELLSTPIEELPDLYWYKDRVALLGDAAHAMTPNLGQGAGMAIEDAYVLAEQLVKHPVHKALEQYQALRQVRVCQVHTTARLMGSVGQWQWKPAVALRNTLLRFTPEQVSRQRLEAILTGGPIKAA